MIEVWRWPKEPFEAPSFEKIELKQPQGLGQRPFVPAEKLQVGEQEIHRKRHPNLAEDSVLRGAQKALDLEVLFRLY